MIVMRPASTQWALSTVCVITLWDMRWDQMAFLVLVREEYK